MSFCHILLKKNSVLVVSNYKLVFLCTQGLFAKRRQLILTEGPHLFYVDPHAMVLKGEIPWYVVFYDFCVQLFQYRANFL